MARNVVGRGPAAEPGAVEVGEGRDDPGLGVSHERTVLRHRLADRSGPAGRGITGRVAIDELDIPLLGA